MGLSRLTSHGKPGRLRSMSTERGLLDPGLPSDYAAVLRSLAGRTITNIYSYIHVGDLPSMLPGRLGGFSSGLEVDSGLSLVFSLLDSLSAMAVYVERDANGQDWCEPIDEKQVRKIDAGDPLHGASSLMKFVGSTIERVEILHMNRRQNRQLVAPEERGILLGCGHGELVFGVGLDREDAMCDYPGIFLLADLRPERMLTMRRISLTS